MLRDDVALEIVPTGKDICCREIELEEIAHACAGEAVAETLADEVAFQHHEVSHDAVHICGRKFFAGGAGALSDARQPAKAPSTATLMANPRIWQR